MNFQLIVITSHLIAHPLFRTNDLNYLSEFPYILYRSISFTTAQTEKRLAPKATQEKWFRVKIILVIPNVRNV